ncbi:MAG TPA: DUF3106 domain-containing protein [Pseudoxanthomonas sp.]|nr:DUF3106 domain-containing protein [Pseudoxanthomonas sp.]
MKTLRIAACILALLLPVSAAAEAAPAHAALPAWERLTPEQRELLLTPLRDRWNGAAPAERARMLEHARRWKALPPEERERARRGVRRFEQMTPEQREHARAIFHATRDLPPPERRQFLQRWEKMTPEQRRQWLQDHPPPPRP